MSLLDASFLHIEDGVNHMHIASCAIFEGPAPTYDALVELFRSKVPLVPRYRQKVRFVPGAIARPVWVDDAHFRLEYHLRHTALPAPGGDDQLRTLMGRLMSQQLDRNRPLWETWMVEGLSDGRWALISKVHHCMVDGISGTDLMAVVLDLRPDSTVVEPEAWTPAPEPSDAQLLREAIGESVASPAGMLRLAETVLKAPQTMLESAGEVFSGAQAMGRRLRPNQRLAIDGPIGPHRRWAWARVSLAEVKLVRATLGGTVNDVVLAAISGGFRTLLLGRGDVGEDAVVRTLVPVSVRTRGDHTYNNQVSGMIAELPIGIAEPVARLEAIRRQMAGLKESHQAVAGSALTELAGFAPPMLLSLGLRAAIGMMRRTPQHSVNTVTTNVPGPQFPLYACGREMLEYFPFVPISHGMRTGVAILSYNGNVAFGVTGDWDSMPDTADLAAGIEAGMRELLVASAERQQVAEGGDLVPERRPRRPRKPSGVVPAGG